MSRETLGYSFPDLEEPLKSAPVYTDHRGLERVLSPDQQIYSWQSGEGGYNRLRYGVKHYFDVAAYVIITDPTWQFPETIELPDDELEYEEGAGINDQ